jgi:AsmA-like C-terminal region
VYRISRKAWIGAGIVAAALLVVSCAALLLGVDRYTTSIESTASAALGMNFKVRGKASFQLFPRAQLTLRDIHVSDGGIEVLSADAVQATTHWVPLLLHQRLSIDRLSLVRPTIRIEQSSEGKITAEDSTAPPGAMSLVSIQQGHVIIVDRTTGTSVDVGDLTLMVNDISWPHSASRHPFTVLKSLSLHGTLRAAQLQIGEFKASDVRCTLTDNSGLLQLDSTEVTLFGGISRGSLTLDLRGSAPRLRLVQAASQIDLTQAFPVQIFLGKAQASLDVTGTGHDQRQIATTLRGQVAIQSEHITLNAVNIDGLIADYNRSQNFSLIDLASLVIVGPFAPLLTKGVDFSRLGFFGRLGKGKSEIRRVVSDWTIANGVATTKDVAFTTVKNTVAFRGDLNLIDGTYHNFFVATVDEHGCTRVKRQVSGSLTHPNAEGPVQAGIGPFKSAARSVVRVFHHPCDPFYSGSAIQ